MHTQPSVWGQRSRSARALVRACGGVSLPESHREPRVLVTKGLLPALGCWGNPGSAECSTFGGEEANPMCSCRGGAVTLQ